MTEIPGGKNLKFERKKFLPYRCVSLEIVVANEISNKQYENVNICCCFFKGRDCHGRDCIVVGFTTTYTISAYHH